MHQETSAQEKSIVATIGAEPGPGPVEALASKVQAEELWGFFHTDCVHESAYGLVSLHRSKAAAWRAMHRAQWNAWVKVQTPDNLPKDALDRRKDSFTGKAYVYERSCIDRVLVTEEELPSGPATRVPLP